MNRPVELTTALYRLTELKPDGREERCPSAFACAHMTDRHYTCDDTPDCSRRQSPLSSNDWEHCSRPLGTGVPAAGNTVPNRLGIAFPAISGKSAWTVSPKQDSLNAMMTIELI